jgi:tetratricopeptide (TPR) repeat protein
MLLSELFHELPSEAKDDAPEPLRSLLHEPLDVTRDWARAEHLLLSAQAQLPSRLEISVALYKMYAYTSRYLEALTLIDAVLVQAAEQVGIEADYRKLQSTSSFFANATGPARHYLYALKAKSFVYLRQGKLEAAESVLEKLSALDPFDQVGGSVVRDMAKKVRELRAALPN